MYSRSNISKENFSLLWAGLRQGNELAFSGLISIFTNQLYQYGIRFNTDPEFVKDCVQDVFVELWNRRDKIRQAECIKSYLYKSLRLKIFREQSKWKHPLPLEDNYEFLIEFDVESTIIREEHSHDTRQKLQLVLSDLPKRQKEILFLRFYEGFTQDKIAEVMNLNRQSVYNLMHEAILNLRKFWSKRPVYNNS